MASESEYSNAQPTEEDIQLALQSATYDQNVQGMQIQKNDMLFKSDQARLQSQIIEPKIPERPVVKDMWAWATPLPAVSNITKEDIFFFKNLASRAKIKDKIATDRTAWTHRVEADLAQLDIVNRFQMKRSIDGFERKIGVTTINQIGASSVHKKQTIWSRVFGRK